VNLTIVLLEEDNINFGGPSKGYNMKESKINVSDDET